MCWPEPLDLKPCWAVEGGHEAIRETNPCAGWASLIRELGVTGMGHGSMWGEAEPGEAQDIHEGHSDGDRLRPGRTPSCVSSCVEAGWGTARVVHTGPGWQKWRWKPCTQLQAAASLPWRQRHLVAPRPRGGRARPHGGRRRRSAWGGRVAPQEGAWHQRGIPRVSLSLLIAYSGLFGVRSAGSTSWKLTFWSTYCVIPSCNVTAWSCSPVEGDLQFQVTWKILSHWIRSHEASYRSCVR